MFYIGVDIAKYNHEASIIDSNGKLVSESFSFSNSIRGLEKFQKFISSFSIDSNNCIIGMEATGHYWLSLYSFLIDLGFYCVVINPIQSDAFRKMYIRQAKNDSVDSFVIAQILRFGEFSLSHFSDEDTFALRNLSRFRFALVDEASDWKRKLVAILDQVFPEYSSLFSNIYGVASKELLSKYPLPEDMISIPADELAMLLSKCSKGRFGIDKAKEIQEKASNSFGVKFALKSFSFQIKQIIAQISFLEDQIIELEDEISSMINSLCPVITSITGIGDVARKLTNIIFAVLRDNKAYIPNI